MARLSSPSLPPDSRRVTALARSGCFIRPFALMCGIYQSRFTCGDLLRKHLVVGEAELWLILQYESRGVTRASRTTLAGLTSAGHGWQGCARGSGSMMTETELIAQWPDCRIIPQFSKR